MRIIVPRPASLAISLVALLVAAPTLAQDLPIPAAPSPANIENSSQGAALPPLDPSIEVAPAPGVAGASPAPGQPSAKAPGAAPRPAAQAKPRAPKPAVARAPLQAGPKVTALPPAAPSEPIKLSDDPRPALTPQTLTATMQAADQYREIEAAGGWPSVPNDVTRLKPGASGPVVTALKKRLVVTGDIQNHELSGNAYDEAAMAGVRRFQARHGLEPTGLIGPRTLIHLNIPVATRIRQLDASASRLTGSKFPFGERYVVVNIPGAAVEAIDHGAVVGRYVAVVGRPERPSPQVETRVTSVNFNPTWTVPVSIIKKDIIPHVRKDPGYLAKMHIRLFDGQGQEVDPATIDWSTDRAANYTVRQDSGADNSLGEVRIDMPNKHAVYMHDTPSKRLFSRSVRTQSSGCVRVSGVKSLVAWLLEKSAGPRGAGSSWTPMEIETAIAGGARIDARLGRSVPVAWVYLTGYGSADGGVHFRDDVYGLDEAKPAAPAPAIPSAAPEPAATSSIPLARKQAQRDPIPVPREPGRRM